MVMTPADIIRAAGEALFGARWQRPLAEAIGRNEKLIRRYLAGEADPPAEYMTRLGGLVSAQRASLAADWRESDTHLAEIEKALQRASLPRR